MKAAYSSFFEAVKKHNFDLSLYVQARASVVKGLNPLIDQVGKNRYYLEYRKSVDESERN